MILTLCFILTTVQFIMLTSVTVATDDLVLVQILYRHGQRTPTKTYPTDPYRDHKKYWPQGLGQLTDEGKRTQLKLGQYLNGRYPQFFNRTYLSADIYVRSSDVDRTLMSAECNLLGLYPNTGKNIWDENYKWQPIPIHTTPTQLDTLLRDAECPRAKRETKKLQKEYKHKVLTDHKKLLDYLVKHTGQTEEHLLDLWGFAELYDTLFIENDNNLTLPEWTKDVFPQPLQTFNEKSFTYTSATPVLRRLRGGSLVKHMIKNMEKKLAESLTQDAMMFSGHDTSVSMFLGALKVFDIQSPPYASTVMVELWTTDSGSVVKIYFRNETNREPYQLQIPGCAKNCPLEQFKQLTRDVIPDNWHAECELDDTISCLKLTEREKTVLIVVAVVCVSLAVITALLLLYVLCLVKKKHSETIAYTPLNSDR